jgi:YD repeat-containing protein
MPDPWRPRAGPVRRGKVVVPIKSIRIGTGDRVRDPDGIVETWTYDQASRITQIDYDETTTHFGTIDYGLSGTRSVRHTSRTSTESQPRSLAELLSPCIARRGRHPYVERREAGSRTPVSDVSTHRRSPALRSRVCEAASLVQCRLSFGGFGSRAGGIVSLSRMRPSRP